MNKRIILFINPDDSTAHKASANASIYPNLGLLTVMSALSQRLGTSNVEFAYLDGTVIGNEAIEHFVDENSQNIFAVCASLLTSNYGAALRAFELLKSKNSKAITIVGNDHFSALYSQILKNRAVVDFGFAGNDVVLGFADFLADQLAGASQNLNKYAGLVYRDRNSVVTRNPEEPFEISNLPLIDYSLMNHPFDHRSRYLEGQRRTYFFMRELGLASMVVDIGRGCIKFSGSRMNEIPLNACDFCAIIPGTKAITTQTPDRAWSILENCYRSGFNYFYVTADELPLTFWPVLKEMSLSLPKWFVELPDEKKPRMFGYTRAEAFVKAPDRIDALVDKLRFNHFFIGFDGLSEISLMVMNKQPIGQKKHDLMWHNMEALNQAVAKNCLITGGIVLTHLGITREILQTNYLALETSVARYPKAFAALDFGPLCPIPGSLSFEYFRKPSFAEERATSFGLKVNRDYLESVSARYKTDDLFVMDELVKDFVVGCCPDINMDDVNEYLAKTTKLAQKHGIVVGGGV